MIAHWFRLFKWHRHENIWKRNFCISVKIWLTVELAASDGAPACVDVISFVFIRANQLINWWSRSSFRTKLTKQNEKQIKKKKKKERHNNWHRAEILIHMWFWNRRNSRCAKMIRIYYGYGIWSAALVLLFVTHTVAVASSAGKGDYEAYNSKKLILTSDKKSTGKFFTGGGNRAPAHDTPASTCKCSKYILAKSLHIEIANEIRRK